MSNTRIREGFEEDACFLHDALAMGIAINEGLRKTVKTKKYFVDVETEGELSFGQTIADRRRVPEFKEFGAMDICFDIDFFIKEFFNDWQAQISGFSSGQCFFQA